MAPILAPKSSQHLPDAELDVLAALSRIEPATAGAVREVLQSYRPMAHGSVLTLLKRLTNKGYVSREKGPVGKAFLYRSEANTRSALRGVVQGLAGRIFAGDRVALVESLFDGRPPNTEEIDRLRLLLDELEQRPIFESRGLGGRDEHRAATLGPSMEGR